MVFVWFLTDKSSSSGELVNSFIDAFFILNFTMKNHVMFDDAVFIY